MQFDPLDLAQPQIRELSPYLAGASEESVIKTHGIDPSQIVKLNSNENPNGPSPKTQQAARQAISQSHRYPDNQALIQAIAKKHHVDASQVIVGNGSTEIIDMIARAFLGNGTGAVSSQYAFAMFQAMSHLNGAKNIVVPAQDYSQDLIAMSQALTSATRIIWLANPNNPTGAFLPYQQIKSFLEKIPTDKILVLDEAYFDYLDPNDQTDATKWLTDHPNLIILRTFSKIHGLAGLRIGYGINYVKRVQKND